MSQKETSGYYSAIETYNGEGTQSLSVTDTIDSNSSSVFWDKNDKHKQIIHGHSLCELSMSGISKSATWGGVQTFNIDNETDCIGDMYICLTVDFDIPDTPLDQDLSPKTITTLLQKPSPRDALKDPSKIEKKGWYKRGVAKGDTHPIATSIGIPNGWLHLKTDANDLGSGFRNGDGGLDAVDSYGLPTDAINLPGVWGVHQDSSPRAQAWEDIQDVLVKDKDLFTQHEFDCKDTHLDPNNKEDLIYQRSKDVGIGEFIVQDQGRTASNCYAINSNLITSVDRFRSFNVMESYYHNGIRNKFNDEFSHPEFSDQNSITADVIFSDPNLKGHQIYFSGYHQDNQMDQHTLQISAVFPNTVTTAQIQANLSSYNTALYNSINNIAILEDYGTWSGTITSNVVTTPNRNWDHILWFGRYLIVQQYNYVLNAIRVAPNVAAPYGDDRPQVSSNIWTPQSTLSFVDDKNNGSIAHVYITEDPFHSKDGNVINSYVNNMRLWMTNYEMEHPYKNWPGNISTDTHRASEASTDAIRKRTFVWESDLLNPGSKASSPGIYWKELYFEYKTEGFTYPELPSFKPRPGSELVSAMFETISGVNYIRLDFWKPTKVDERDITQQELEIYISSTRSILTKIQNEADDSVQGVADCPRVFWTITTTTGNSEILIPLTEYNRPIGGPNNGIGQFIGGGVNNDYSLGENDIRFDLHADRIFTPYPGSPWPTGRSYDVEVWDYQILTGYPEVTTTDPSRVNTSRLLFYIPNTFYKLNDVIAKAPEWQISIEKFGNMYTAYRARFEDIENDKNTIFEFRTANYISGSDNIPGSLIRVIFNTYFPSGQLEFNETSVEIALEVSATAPPALNTIPNRKGHDNIISPSLIPYVEHPTVNPYTYSYLPKYLSYNDSEEIKKLGTEYIDVDENGAFRVYRSQGVLAGDLFISYLDKQDINNLVDYYNRNISYRPLFQSNRDIPETITPQDGDIISYLQKVEAVEDPPKRPDNLIYYQSDFNGYCTAMSSDGNTYAVSQGRMYGDESEAYANVNGVDRYRVRRPGLVRVFKKENGTWTLNKTFRAPNSKLTTRSKGHVWYVSNGYNQHIDLSGDGNRIVIGDAGGDNNSFTTYDYNTITKKWTKVSEVQCGHSQSIIPQHTGLRKYVYLGDPPEYYTYGSEFGSCLSLSDDGNRIVLRYIGPESNSPNNTYTTEHSVKIYNWDGTNWQVDNSTPDVSVSLNHHYFVLKDVDHDDIAVRLGGYPDNQQPIWSQNEKYYRRSGSICLSGDGNTYIMGDHNGVISSPSTALPFTVQSVGGSNKYFYNGQQQPTIELISGTTYTFSFPANHQVRLSTTPDGTHAGGVILEPGPQNSYDVPITGLPGTILYYFCVHHAGMGGQINIVAPTNDSGINVYKLFNGIWTRVLTKYNGHVHGDGVSCTVNYDGTRIAFGNIIYENGVGSVSIYDWDSISNSYLHVKEIVGQPNSYLGTSIKFNKDGTKLAIGCPYGINEKKPMNKPRTRDLTNVHIIVENNTLNNNEPVQTEFGRIGVFRYPDFVPIPNPPPESYEIGFDKNEMHLKARGGHLYDTELGAIKGWAEYGSPASLGMRNERQRLSHGEVHLYEYKSGDWENVLKIDATNGERGNSKQKPWPGTHGKYGIYEGTADGLGVSVSIDGNGDVILAGAPFTSTIGKIQEKLDWYPGGGMTAAYSIHKNNEESLVEEGDNVSSLLLADTSLRSHIRETEEEVGRSYLFQIGKYTHNPPAPTPVENTSNIKMNYSDGYTLVNNAQFRLNHDITDFINLPDIGEPIRWDKQFNSVPEGAYYPPLKGDYQNPEWADSDLKSKVDFPLLSIIKKVEIIVNDKVWQTIENADLLSIYSTEMTESLYQTTISNSRGRSLSDGTRKENSKERWIPGKKYNLTIPIPGFTSSVDPRFNNFTNISENGFLAGIAPDSKFTVKVYYNELEKIWDTNNVSAMQGYTAPIYRVPHVTTKIEDGQDSNGNPSSLVKDGAIYETTGKSSRTGLYVTNVPEPWNPKISFNTKMYGQKIVMNREELDVLKNTPDGITKKIKLSKNVSNRFINVSRNKILSMNLDEISMYTSHLIINVEYTNISTKPYLKTAQLFLNSKQHSILDGLFMRGISTKSLGIYSNEYGNNMYYIYPLSNKAFGGSSVSFSKFDSIRLELIFDSQSVSISNKILSEFINVSVTARGQGSVSYKNGSAIMNY